MEINIFYSLLITFSYYLIGFLVCLITNKFTSINQEIKRKLLHFVGFLAIFIYLYCYSNLLYSSIICLVLGILSFIGLKIVLKLSFFQDIFITRKKNEVELTILKVFIIQAFIILLTYFTNNRIIALLSIVVFCFGDAFASLFGKKYGKHHFNNKIVDQNKSVEGLLSNIFISFIVSLIILLFSKYDINLILLFSLIISLVTGFSELLSKRGNDTIISPLCIYLVSYLLFLL
jgi:dolichol kinase